MLNSKKLSDSNGKKPMKNKPNVKEKTAK